MPDFSEIQRYLLGAPQPHLQRPVAVLQPFLAKEGKPNIDISRLSQILTGLARLNDMVAVQSPAHWEAALAGLPDNVDAILPVSIPAYPTEIWNSHPAALVERRLPVVFWPLLDYDEPDFWRWSARDMLRSLGVEVYIPQNNHEAGILLKALAMKRMLRTSKMVVFGDQNFPWNANAASGPLTRHLGTRVVVRPLKDLRERYPKFSTDAVQQVISERLAGRYLIRDVRGPELEQAVRTSLAIREILEEEGAFGFGLNCFGDLITGGGRDTPCLAQLLLREEGYIAACDGDFIAMQSMALASFFLDKPCMMSNMYPLTYVGALTDHFGDPLSPPAGTPPAARKNMARLAHCGFVGVVSPEMTPSGKTALRDWGGTYEIKRDGRGCGADGDLAGDQPVTILELCFDGKRLLAASARLVETTHHSAMPHCETSALLEFRDLPGLVKNISREHTVLLYGDAIREFEILAEVLGLECQVF